MVDTVTTIQNELDSLKKAGTFKCAPVIDGPMGPTVKLEDGREVVNFCSNNYIGLANHPDVISGALKAIEKYGYGTASVRFICGSFTLHDELERGIADFLCMESATTYVSCWNANEALLPTLLSEGDVVISDEFNHASIIDACRLCGRKVQRLIYRHSDMNDLSTRLDEAKDARRKLIITDGVFSMEGDLANLPDIVKLAKKHDALVIVDDSHAHGVVGKTGRGTPEHFGVSVDVITGTLGKALGGAAGGFVAASKPIIELLVQRSRPQLFSNALPPAVAGGALASIRLLKNNPQLVEQLRENVRYFRDELKKAGIEALESPTAIVPVIVGDTAKAISLAKKMLKNDVLITGFGYPVVPEGTARLRAQISLAHTQVHLDKVLDVFRKLKFDGEIDG
ncbi:MAG: glycine C-acetyltransferase [Anaerohalosphaeraceae bacterium]|nr:glycine C-acetyltransferase [Anaerohalosphaeraceae bacterium]